MTFRRARRTLARVAGVGLTATVLVGLLAVPANADTSQASANAASAILLGTTLVTTNFCTSSNPGAPTPTASCSQTPNLSLLGTQTAIQAGLLVQQTVARGDGTSAACAGLVGNGGTIQIGAGGACTVTGAAPGGVQVNLGLLAVLHADAILAQCTASSTGAPTATVNLVNATINLLAGGVTPVTSTPGPNVKVLNLGALITLTLNAQPVPQATGQAKATALDLKVLGLGNTPVIHVLIGTVVCGANAATVATPAFPAAGLPIAGGMVLVAGYLGWRFWLLPRRRRLAINA